MMTGQELMEELLEIGRTYGSVPAMCKRSNSMRLDTESDPEVLNVLDAAIALQLYIKARKKNDDPETIALLKKTLIDKINGMV